MPQYKLGKLPARKGAVKFLFSDYVDLTKFPKIPDSFGHEDLIKNTDWGMLGNDVASNCVFAGGEHETMMWAAMGGSSAKFTQETSFSDYSAVTGFNEDVPNTDNGTDMQVAASYRKNTGLIDIDGNRHKVAAYLALTPGNLQQHLIAMYLFGAVGIGITFPSYAMDAFNSGDIWDVENGGTIEGGHYVPLVAYRTNIICVTWGKTQPMTPEFFQRNNDESIVYLSESMLKNGKSPEGFDYDQLAADLANLNPSNTVA